MIRLRFMRIKYTVQLLHVIGLSDAHKVQNLNFLSEKASGQIFALISSSNISVIHRAYSYYLIHIWHSHIIQVRFQNIFIINLL